MLRSLDPVLPLAQLEGRLARARASGKRYLALNVPLSPRDWWALAPASGLWPQLGWVEPDETHFLALGACVSFEARGAEALALPDRCRDLLEQAVEADESARELLRALGGIAFDPTADGPAWWGDRPATFVLPECLIRARDGRAEALFCLPLEGAEERFGVLWAALHAPQPKPAAWPRGHRVEEPAAFAAWEASVSRALAAIACGALTKVVLARAIPLAFDAPPSPWAVFARLAERSPGTHRYCFRFSAENAFLGASPELLFGQSGAALWADGLAGTAPRGASEQEDQRHGEALLADVKERHEHAVVVSAIREALTPLTELLGVPETPLLRKLPNVQHLFTPIGGALKPATTLEAVLAALYPTPAVCGTPRADARAFIAEAEGIPRGWYAGAVGWVGASEARFSVAIRSAYMHGDTARVMAGCGLVAGSVAAGEWAECERKAAPLMTLLTGDAR